MECRLLKTMGVGKSAYLRNQYDQVDRNTSYVDSFPLSTSHTRTKNETAWTLDLDLDFAWLLVENLYTLTRHTQLPTPKR